MNQITLVVAVLAAGIGSFLGYLIRQIIAKKQIGSAESKISSMLADAKSETKEILISAKDKAVKILEDAKKEEAERRTQLIKLEERVSKREENLDRKLSSLEREEKEFQSKIEKVKSIKAGLEKIEGQKLEELQKISGLSRGEAKNILLEHIENEHKEDILALMKKIEAEGKKALEEKAKEIIISSIQRYGTSQVSELTTTTVSIPSDDLKGKIIGREGRNIRTLERLTGVEIIVDETPETIIISGFDPVRRQIAKIALEKLVADGRIQPARIEEMVEKAKETIEEKIKEAGEEAVYQVGIVGLNQKLINLLGRLRFRTSYGQNVLMHSVEAAQLAGMIAAEVGADVAVCKKAGLFHDIGKALDHEIQGSHVEIGRKVLQKFNIDESVIKAMQSHHGEYPVETSEAAIVQVAEAISAARPGARSDSLENYIKRLEELENIANSFDGVEKSYAIQAGREIRIFINPEKLDDLAAKKLAKDIAARVQEELKYPGEIKVTLIRETRVVEYAR